MQLDFSITVTGIPVRPLSCRISFGVNQIPEALVGVDPTIGDVLQNMETYRRTECVVTIKTVDGSLVFPCLFDGMSYSMTPGGMSYTAVFKSQFQTWLEIFPYVPGFHPAGVNPYIRQSMVSTVGGNSANQDVKAALETAIGLSTVAGENLAKTYIRGVMAMIRNQSILNAAAIPDSTTGTNNFIIKNLLPKLASNENPAYAKALATASKLLDLIDTTAIDKFTIQSVHVNQLNFLTNMIMNNPSQSLWELMLSGFQTLGLIVVTGPTKLFVVPECYFMKPSSGHVVPKQKEFVSKPNFASPGFYNNISLSDNGYQDIGGVILSANPYVTNDLGSGKAETPFGVFGHASDIPLYYGSYPSYEGFKNNQISGAIINVPAGALSNLYCSYFQADRTGSNGIAEDSTLPADVTPEEVAAADQANSEANYKASLALRDILDNLALAEFLKRKYQDRTGSINLRYSPNWVPGTTGTAFSRYPEPGTFVDFYVTQVTHVFDNSNGGGTSTTGVSFCSGRMGQTPVGVDINKLYKYTVADQTALQKRFLAALA